MDAGIVFVSRLCLKFNKKQEIKLATASRSLYTLAVIIIKFNSKFSKIKIMIFPMVKYNMSKNTEAIICFILFSHQFFDLSYGSFMM